jgi:uncharacterized RDD family membrane protein YckC
LANCKKCGNELPEGADYCPKCGTAVKAVTELHLANWGVRFVAWLIDILIIGVILGPIRMTTTWPGYVWAQGFPQWIPFLDFGLSNIVYFLYWMLMEGTYGQSLGKMIMRIRVARLNGEAPNIGQAATESAGKAFLLPIDLIVGWIMRPVKRQRIFSYLAGTVVIRTSR